MSRLETRNILIKLYSDGIIEQNERDDLLFRKQAGFPDQELAERLLPMIERKSPEKQEEFIRLVRVRQPHLVKAIDPQETDGVHQPVVEKSDGKRGAFCFSFSAF